MKKQSKKYPCNGPRMDVQRDYYNGKISVEKFLAHCQARTNVRQPLIDPTAKDPFK